LEGPDGSFEASDLPGHQARVAFVALAVERLPVSQDRLADIVWDGAPPPQWRGALAAVLSKTRALLASCGLDGQTMIASGAGAYSFVPPPDTWIDLEHAHRSLDRSEGALRHGDLQGAAAEATVASAILRRPLLPGEDCLWLDLIRDRQRSAFHRSLITLASAWNGLGDHRLAALVAQQAIELDPFRETGHRLLIEAERGSGDSAAALSALVRCEEALADIGTVPSPETVAAAAGLRPDRSH
jgi:DNA-binding SARP family transcriptional activator